MNNIITKSSFLQISNCKFIVNNNIYQLRNIFCLEISGGGGYAPPWICQGGRMSPAPLVSTPGWRNLLENTGSLMNMHGE